MYFLDSNVLIDYLKGTNIHVMEALKGMSPMDVKIPSIIEAELMFGIYGGVDVEFRIRKLEELISSFEIIPFDDSAARIYGKIRAEMRSNGTMIGPNDLLIASTVLSRGGILVTSNTKEFSRIRGLIIENWRS